MVILQCTVHSEDYQKLSVDLEFGSCETRRCVNVSIANDLINEPVEKFSLSLTANPDYHISLFPTSAEVVIIDDDGKCPFAHITLWFSYFSLLRMLGS